MKVTHLCLLARYRDGYTYQENLLAKYHRVQGYEVDVITSLRSFDDQGKPCSLKEPCVYDDRNGVHVVRLAYKSKKRIDQYLGRFEGLEEALIDSKPDILFIHGCQTVSMRTVRDYACSHSQLCVYVDNHADYSNSARNPISKHLIHRLLWRHYAHVIEPVATKFWGVTPGRVDFLIDNYSLPKSKCDLLVMGADDEVILETDNAKTRENTRETFDIGTDDFLIVTGGRIDAVKTQVLDLMSCVGRMENNVRLIVFGPVDKEIKQRFMDLVDGNKVQYLPWADSHSAYELFAAADLVAFPGRHSVYWEQAVGMGRPLLVKRWTGTTHVDLGGNVAFIEEDSAEELCSHLTLLSQRGEAYTHMLDAARSEDRKQFWYSHIAQRAIGGGDANEEDIS